jgi:hypothetical protein
MYQLSRLRFVSVGPEGARLDPLLLDLRTPEGQLATETVLWLENGGGKTVLLRLLFAVLRPDRVAEVGTETTGRLQGLPAFVGDGDTAHVILEWRAVGNPFEPDGEVLITGLVAEWRGRTRSAESSNLNKTWYSVRSRDGSMHLDTLPAFEHSGRRVVRTTYLEQLRALAKGRTAKACDLKIPENQKAWVHHLNDLGLDPALFEYQVLMNRDESGAAKLMRFQTALDFVDFLLKLVMEQDALNQLDQNLHELALKVAAKPLHELQLEFCMGAINGLEQVVAARERHTQATSAVGQLGQEILSLRNRVYTSAQQAMTRAADAKARYDHEHQRERTLRERTTVLDLEKKEFDRLEGMFLLQAAQSKLTKAKDLTTHAKQQALAWREAEVMVSLQEAEAKVQAAEAAYAATVEQSGELRHERDEAGRLLRRRLRAEQQLQRREADHQRQKSQALTEEAEARQQQAQNAALEAQRVVNDRHTWRQKIQKRDSVRGRLRTAGAVNEEETAQAAIQRWQSRLTELAQELSRLQTCREELRTQSAQVSTRLGELQKDDAQTSVEIQRKRQELQKAQEIRIAFHQDERLRQLADDQVFDVELLGIELVKRLKSAVDTFQSQVVDLAVQTAEDHRAVEELGEQGLLPPPIEVVQGVERLRKAGIKCLTGWDYLSKSVSQEYQADVLARRPDLVSGIIIQRADDLPRAEDIIRTAGLAPALAIVFGPSQELVEAETTGPHRHVIPPTKALYDEQTALKELEVRRQRLQHAQQEKDRLSTAAERDRELARHLFEHLQQYPPGSLTSLEKHVEELEIRSRHLRTAIHEAQENLRTWAAEDKTCATREQTCYSERTKCERHVSALATLQEAESESEGADAALERLHTEELEWRSLIDLERNAASEARRAAQEATARSAEYRTFADHLEHDIQRAAVAITEQPVTSEEAAEVAQLLGEIEKLRQTFLHLDDLLVARTTRSEVARARDEAIKERDRWHELVSRIPDDLRPLVLRLISGPDGLTSASRRQASARADEERDRALQDEVTARVATDTARARLQALSPSDQERYVTLPANRMPKDRLDANLLAAETNAALSQTLRDCEEAKTAALKAKDAHEQAQRESDQMNGQLGPLTTCLMSLDWQPEAMTITEPFIGDLQKTTVAIGAQIARVLVQRKQAQAALEEAIHSVTTFSRHDRFAAWHGQLRQRLTQDTPQTLIAQSHTLLADVRTYARQLQSELETLQQHRKIVATGLVELTDEAIKILHSAERQSRLPSGNWPWADKPFIKIKFEAPTEIELENRLDPLVADLARMDAKTRPAGIRLLVRAMETAVTGGFRITVLKPNQAGTVLYVAIDQSDMGTLSGGMRATAAIAIFCTLARLRTHLHSRSRNFGVATLCLDNPLGNANAPYLIELQLSVARAAGIQLLFTTGIKDYDALRQFRNLIGLSNDSARRSTLRYVRTDALLMERITPPKGEGAHLTATRVIAKATSSETA